MSSETVLITLGVIVFISPFVGLPFSVLSWILPLIALGIIGFSYHLRMKNAPPAKSRPVTSTERFSTERTRTDMS